VDVAGDDEAPTETLLEAPAVDETDDSVQVGHKERDTHRSAWRGTEECTNRQGYLSPKPRLRTKPRRARPATTARRAESGTRPREGTSWKYRHHHPRRQQRTSPAAAAAAAAIAIGDRRQRPRPLSQPTRCWAAAASCSRASWSPPRAASKRRRIPLKRGETQLLSAVNRWRSETHQQSTCQRQKKKAGRPAPAAAR
jgi:hypothetical protein